MGKSYLTSEQEKRFKELQNEEGSLCPWVYFEESMIRRIMADVGIPKDTIDLEIARMKEEQTPYEGAIPDQDFDIP
jgi:hypothetical protein